MQNNIIIHNFRILITIILIQTAVKILIKTIVIIILKKVNKQVLKDKDKINNKINWLSKQKYFVKTNKRTATIITIKIIKNNIIIKFNKII